MFHPAYTLLVGLAVLIAVLFPVTRHMKGSDDRRRYWRLQGVTLTGAVIGAKLSVLMGDAGWPWQSVDDWWAVVVSGRSITGALIVGFIAAEVAKPIMGYTMPPNDRFATLLPFTFALGRVGCLLSGCCLGVAWDGWCAVRDAAGVARHPAVLSEMTFQLVVGCVFIALMRRGLLFGRLFSVYLMAYGVFRFGVEFVRDTPKTFGPLSGYQVLCAAMIALGAAFFVKRTLRPPAAWRAYQSVPSPATAPANA